MDILQLYIQQELGDNVKPYFSDSLAFASAGGIIDLNFENEKVKVIIVSNLWISNPTGAPFTIIDQYGGVFINSAAVPAGQSIMCPLHYVHRGSIIKFDSNLATLEFTVILQKVQLYNETYNLPKN